MTEITTRDIAIPIGDNREMKGYLATPLSSTPRSAVLVIHEIFGLDEQMKAHARRIADMGYISLAIDLFSTGSGGVGKLKCLISVMRTVVKGKGPAIHDVYAARDFLSSLAQCNGTVGVIGFCMGGGFALLTAPHGFEVASVNYAQIPKNIDQIVVESCPIIGSFGAKDKMIKQGAARLEEALEKAHITHDIKEYPEVGHCFLNTAEVGPRLLRPLFRVMGTTPGVSATEDAWARIAQYFATYL